MAEPQPERASLPLVVFCAAGIAVFATGQGVRPAWLLLGACLIAPFFALATLPGWLQTGARWGTRLALAALGLLGMAQQLYPVLSDESIGAAARVCGWALGIQCGLYLISPRVWRPASPALLCGLGLLIAGCFAPLARLGFPIGVATLALFVYLAEWRQALMRSLAFGAAVAALALGIAHFLPWAQPLVEEATARMINPGITPTTGLGTTSRLGEVARLALSRNVVLRMRASEPQKLRAHVFTTFDGTTWTAGTRTSAALPAWNDSLEPELAEWAEGVPGRLFRIAPGPTGPAIHSTIVQALATQGALPAPRGLLVGRFPEDVPVRLANDRILEPGAGIDVYGIVNQKGAAPDPGDTCASCLDVPAALDPRVAALAERLGAGAVSPEARIERTRDHFMQGYTYSLEVGAFQTRDPVAEFLFDKRRGYCEYFASAAVLLLRLQRVPSRYVTGFNVQDTSYEGGRYVVRESDAHAWVEAWTVAQGWVEVDPTPPAQYAALHTPQTGHFERFVEWLRTQWDEIVQRISHGAWRSLLRYLWQAGGGRLTVTLAVIGALLWLWRRRGPRRPRAATLAVDDGDTSPALRALLAQLDRTWARSGLARPASRAPLEHLQGLLPEELSPGLRDVSRKIVDCFYRERFAREPAAEADVAALGALLARAAAERPGPTRSTRGDRNPAQ